MLICAEYPDAEREKLLLLVIPKSPKLFMLKKELSIAGISMHALELASGQNTLIPLVPHSCS